MTSDSHVLPTWMRLEPHARTADVKVGLAAEVADPLWFIGRQLQFGELTGDDGGAPVAIDIHTSWSRFTRYRAEGSPLPGETKPDRRTAEFTDASGPLEALVEREAELVEDGAWAPRVRAGRDLARRLRAGSLASLATKLATDPGTGFAAPEPVKGEIRGDDDDRYALLLSGRVIDGAKVLAAVGEHGKRKLRNDLTRGLSRAQAKKLDEVLAAWAEAVEKAWGTAPAGRTQAAAWVGDRLEYAFKIGAPPLPDSDKEIVLSAAEYDGRGVDWFAFDLVDSDRNPGETLSSGPRGEDSSGERTLTVLPSPLTFPGAPADRYWEFEDSAVSLGATTAGPTDLVQLIATEFTIVSSPDWLLAPVEVPVGSVTSIDWIVVRDTFGAATLVGDRKTQAGDGVGRQFQPSAVQGAEGDNPLLIVLPSSLGPLRSAPRERVSFQRDEMANLAWAIEQTVAGPVGRGVDRTWAPAELTMPEPDLADEYDLVWRLSTPVPSTWFPMVARVGKDGRRLLVKARLLHTPKKEIRASASGVMAGLPPVHEEEITRTGCRVEVLDQLVRWHDGETFVWRGREKRAGRGEASSALRYDDATPRKST